MYYVAKQWSSLVSAAVKVQIQLFKWTVWWFFGDSNTSQPSYQGMGAHMEGSTSR